jgi:hypothetical protein
MELRWFKDGHQPPVLQYKEEMKFQIIYDAQGKPTKSIQVSGGEWKDVPTVYD